MDFWTLAQTVGIPLAMTFTALILGQRRVWVWGSELVSCETREAKALDDYKTREAKLIADYEARLEAQRVAHAGREAETASSAEKWQILLFESIPALKGLTEAVNAQARAQIQRGG